MMYRLLTQRTNVRGIRKLMVRLRLDYSLFLGSGGYHLSPEKTMAIELAMVTRETALATAMEIGMLNNQESVLVQEIPVVSELVRMPQTSVNESLSRSIWIECLRFFKFLRRPLKGM